MRTYCATISRHVGYCASISALALGRLYQRFVARRRGIAASLIVYSLTAVLLWSILFSVIAQLLDYYGDRSSVAWMQQWRAVPWPTVTILIALVPVTWSITRIIAGHIAPLLTFHQTAFSTLFRYVVRLLAVLPTLIVGNSVLTLSDMVGTTPYGYTGIVPFFLVAFLLMVMPTVLNVSYAMVKTTDRTALQHAIALGLSEPYAARHVIMPRLRVSLDTAITLAITRVVVEIAVVVNTSSLLTLRDNGLPRDSATLFSTFRAIYGSVTVESNAIAIVILFIVAVLLSSFSIGIGALHAGR